MAPKPKKDAVVAGGKKVINDPLSRSLDSECRAMSRVLTKLASIMTGTKLPVQWETNLGFPAQYDGTKIDYDRTTFQTLVGRRHLPEMGMTLLGLLHHEVSHALFTPDPLALRLDRHPFTTYNQRTGVAFTAQQLFGAANALEDQRIETLYSGMYWSAGDYFAYAVATFILNNVPSKPSEQEDALRFVLTYGRKYLPRKVRAKAEADYRAHGSKAERLADEYMKLVDAYLLANPAQNYDLDKMAQSVFHTAVVMYEMGILDWVTPPPHKGKPQLGNSTTKGKADDQQQQQLRQQLQQQMDAEKNDDQAGSGGKGEPDKSKEDNKPNKSGGGSSDGDDEEEDEDEGNGSGGGDTDEDEDEDSDSGDGGDDESDDDPADEDDSATSGEEGNDADSGDDGDDEQRENDNSKGYDGIGSGGEGDTSQSITESLNDLIDSLVDSTQIRQELGDLDRDLTVEREKGDPFDPKNLRHSDATTPVPADLAAVSERAYRTLFKLRASAGESRERRLADGKINVMDFVTRDMDDLDVFVGKTEGEEDLYDFEVVILLDVSASMSGDRIRAASQSLWAGGYALERIGADITVIAYGAQNIPIKLPKHRYKPHVYSNYNANEWSTNAAAALTDAFNILTRSKRRNRILISITDGGWGDSHQADPIVQRLNNNGVTTMLICITGGGAFTETHNHQLCESVVNAADILPLYTKLVHRLVNAR